MARRWRNRVSISGGAQPLLESTCTMPVAVSCSRAKGLPAFVDEFVVGDAWLFGIGSNQRLPVLKIHSDGGTVMSYFECSIFVLLHPRFPR